MKSYYKYALYILLGLTIGCNQINKDTIDPTVTLNTYYTNARSLGNLELMATPQDNQGIQKVIFYVDGQEIGNVYQTPFYYVWKVPSIGDKTVVISAVAIDYAGNKSEIAYKTIHIAQHSIVQEGNIFKADVGVVGCHASGSGAALVAAQQGLSVVMVCEENQAGGMLTSGQIGFVDGSPRYEWYDHPLAAQYVNGLISKNTSWQKTSVGIWQEFRSEVAKISGKSVDSTIRMLPKNANVALQTMIAKYPNLKVFYKSKNIISQTNISTKTSISSVAFASDNKNFNLQAKYWVDGSDTGRLVGAAKLPYELGLSNMTNSKKNFAVMQYGYRITAEESDKGAYPTQKPAYYDINRQDFDALTNSRLPVYFAAYPFNKQGRWAIHPMWILSGTQGRLSGQPADLVQNPSDGLAIQGNDKEIWDINSFNNRDSNKVAAALYTNSEVSNFFERLGIINPYGPKSTDIIYRWANITWIEDSAPIAQADKDILIGYIKDYLRNTSLGFIWYIRSGDFLDKVRNLAISQFGFTEAEANNLTVRDHWSLSKQITQDGIPELLYQREGRRIKTAYQHTVEMICQNSVFDDIHKIYVCSDSAPTAIPDQIATGDYHIDIHSTAGAPQKSIALNYTYPVPFRVLIPENTTGILIGSAIGVDRGVYGAFRLDPLRMMVGGAIGYAISLAESQNITDFNALDMASLQSVMRMHKALY